jgi:hypothetical protein
MVSSTRLKGSLQFGQAPLECPTPAVLASHCLTVSEDVGANSHHGLLRKTGYQPKFTVSLIPVVYDARVDQMYYSSNRVFSPPSGTIPESTDSAVNTRPLFYHRCVSEDDHWKSWLWEELPTVTNLHRLPQFSSSVYHYDFYQFHYYYYYQFHYYRQ